MLPKQPNKSLIDGIRCLQALASSPGPVGVTDLARDLDLEATRVHRLLRTLGHMGFARQNVSRKYLPGPAIFPLATHALYASHLMQVAVGPLDSLRAEIPHVVALGMLWERRVSYLYHANQATPPDKVIGSFGFWAATDSGVGMAVLARHSDEEIREFYSKEEILNHPAGVDSLLAALERIRVEGHAFIATHSKGNWHTLGIASAVNPFMGIGISGKLKKKDIAVLLPKIRAIMNAIDQATQR